MPALVEGAAGRAAADLEDVAARDDVGVIDVKDVVVGGEGHSKERIEGILLGWEGAVEGRRWRGRWRRSS